MKPQSEWTNIDYLEEGRRQERRDLVEWLNERCEEESHFPEKGRDHYIRYVKRGYTHRKDCPVCWASVQSSGLSKLMGQFPDL